MKGLKEAVSNLNKEVAKIKRFTREGMQDAAFFVEGESVEMTPIDMGVLRNSSFTDVGVIGNTIKATIGYTAKYAPWVHEMPMTLKGQPRANFGKTNNLSEFGPKQVIEFGGGSLKGRYWDGGENKFLEKAIKFNHAEILRLIAQPAKNEMK